MYTSIWFCSNFQRLISIFKIFKIITYEPFFECYDLLSVSNKLSKVLYTLTTILFYVYIDMSDNAIIDVNVIEAHRPEK